MGSPRALSLDVTPLVTGNSTYSVILRMDSGGNDIWFGLKESSRKPQLIILTSGTSTITQSQSAHLGNADAATIGIENARGLLHII